MFTHFSLKFIGNVTNKSLITNSDLYITIKYYFNISQ